MIVVPALHPAYEVTARVDRLVAGSVHRVGPEASSTGIGGKALNVARFVARMGVHVRLVVLADPPFLARLEPLAAGAPTLEVVTIPSTVPTRTDIVIVDERGDMTVVNAMAPDPGDATIKRLHAAAFDRLRAGDILVLSGSTPDGTLGVHPRLARDGRARGATVVADASGPWLRALLAAQPDVVKINATEARELAATGDRPTLRDDSGPQPRERPAALATCPVVGITNGAAGLHGWLPDGSAVRVTPPPGLPVQSPLGAGDAVTAGLAIALARGDGPLAGLVLGTAIAAASLRHAVPDVVVADVDALLSRVVVETLG